MSQTKWVIEFKGERREVVTEDRDGHTAHKAWQKGVVFFKEQPSFPQCRVTRVVIGVKTVSARDFDERSRRAFEALKQPGEELELCEDCGGEWNKTGSAVGPQTIHLCGAVPEPSMFLTRHIVTDQ